MILAKVPSLSHPHEGVFYDIEAVDGRVTCTCPRFSFGKRETATCSHVKVYESALKALHHCNESGHVREIQGVCGACLVALIAGMTSKVKRQYVPKAEAKAKIAQARKRKRR